MTRSFYALVLSLLDLTHLAAKQAQLLNFELFLKKAESKKSKMHVGRYGGKKNSAPISD